MGQKVNPISLRLGINRGWDSIWFDEKKFSDRINEDILIRRYLENRFSGASISKIKISRKNYIYFLVIYLIHSHQSILDRIPLWLRDLTS